MAPREPRPREGAMGDPELPAMRPASLPSYFAGRSYRHTTGSVTAAVPLIKSIRKLKDVGLIEACEVLRDAIRDGIYTESEGERP